MMKAGKAGMCMAGNMYKSLFFLLMLAAGAVSAASPSGWYINNYKGPVQKNWVPEPADAVAALGFGMIELTQYPNQQPTEKQKQAAAKLVRDSIRSAKKHGWFDQKKAFADGYELMFEDETHYINKAFVMDDQVLNPERPEFLMYYPTDKGMLLIGIMYGVVARGPQIGGPLTLWHYHLGHTSCYENGVFPMASPNEKNECAKGIPLIKSPEMLHVWFFNHPDGRFATRMGLNAAEMQQAIREIEQLKQ